MPASGEAGRDEKSKELVLYKNVGKRGTQGDRETKSRKRKKKKVSECL